MAKFYLRYLNAIAIHHGMRGRSLGARLLEEWRAKKKLTQTALGQLVGISQPVISEYEAGTRAPGRTRAVRIESVTMRAVTVESWDQEDTAQGAA